MCILLFYMYFGISYFIFICLAGNVIINVIDIVLLLSNITETIPDFFYTSYGLRKFQQQQQKTRRTRKRKRGNRQELGRLPCLRTLKYRWQD